MYIKNATYLGDYSNNILIAPIADSDNFGLDDYEPEFFFDPVTWKTEGQESGGYEVALKFDIDDFEDDIFYFCHVSNFVLIDAKKSLILLHISQYVTTLL